MELLRSVGILCPYCGEPQDIDVDCSISEQSYVEDCQICCQPMNVSITVDENGEPMVSVGTDND